MLTVSESCSKAREKAVPAEESETSLHFFKMRRRVYPDNLRMFPCQLLQRAATVSGSNIFRHKEFHTSLGQVGIENGTERVPIHSSFLADSRFCRQFDRIDNDPISGRS